MKNEGKGHIFKEQCYVLNYVPRNSYVEVLTPFTSECDCIWLDMGSLERQFK